jgi:phage tail-like protein
MANYAIITLDIDPPVISGISPEVSSQDIATDEPLVFTITDTLAGINIATLSLTIAGEQALAGGVVQPGYTGQITQISGVYSISVTRDEGWAELTNIIYQIRIQDMVGNELVYQGSFYTTGSYTDIEYTGEWINLGEDGTVLKGQLRRFLKLISFSLDEAKGLIDAFPVILNVDKTDADYLPLIAVLVGIDFNYDIPIPRQREEIKRAVEVYKAKGTIPGIKTFGRTISGLSVDIQEWPKNILMSNDTSRLSAQASIPEVIDKTGLPGDQCIYSLDFSDSGDYRFDKFGIYFYLTEKGGLLKSGAEKLKRLLAKYIPASTMGKLIFIDHVYQFTISGQLSSNIYHAFGTGNEAWDDQLPQPPTSQTELVNEIYRCKPDSIVYLDENDQVTTTPTNRIRVLSILDNNEPDIDGHYIREQGLFGEDGNTLLGVVNHKGQWKGNGYRIWKQIELTFQ